MGLDTNASPGLERRQLGVYCGGAGMPKCKFRPKKSVTCFDWPKGHAFTGPEPQSKSYARDFTAHVKGAIEPYEKIRG
jgi:hypothetical protein